MEEKLWIIRQNKEHKKNSQTRLALDFSVKFKRPITRSCICKTLNKSEEILALARKNPELETKKTFKLQKLTLGAVVTILLLFLLLFIIIIIYIIYIIIYIYIIYILLLFIFF